MQTDTVINIGYNLIVILHIMKEQIEQIN